jgi:hypothetical protein
MNIEEHNTPVVENAILETLKELLILNSDGTGGPERLRFLVNYFAERRSEVLLKYHSIEMKDILPNQSNFTGITSHEKFLKGNRMQDTIDHEMVRALRNKKIYRLTYYRNAYEGLRDTEIHKGWPDLLTEIYEEDKALNWIFVRLVEERTKKAVTSSSALQESTGITRLGYDKNNEKEEARRHLEKVFISAMRYRYEMFLEEMLERGEKYNDLLTADPSKFNLSETQKADAVEEAIYNFFELGDPSILETSIEDLAMRIGAPVELVIRASQRDN